ncbi:hypothetical protein [Paenibacillus methanolicus]|uniref:YtkA-like protein n=1 Tax=Paenibacillus methanolicus TaxID=582686 RepID=A0A5S5BUS6_9BACL|nr:hypothetical protein [Paenibacillus methanolicus]TYP70777.1 hypothetical protein BCM02_111285 [Paenibacillus methanolicus]
MVRKWLVTALAAALVLGAATGCAKKEEGDAKPAAATESGHGGHDTGQEETSAADNGHEAHDGAEGGGAEAAESGEQGADEAASAEAGGHSGHGSSAGGGHEESAGSAVQTEATWSYSSDKPAPGADTVATIRVTDAAGKAVEKFDINHEKEMHLIVVSKDLSFFNHIHPVYKGKGQFEVKTAFPEAGEYKLIADYIPSGGGDTTKSDWLTVDGTPAAPAKIEPDQQLTRTVDGVEVALEAPHLMADMEVELNFAMKDAATKQPITDLQPYLGAVGHVVILSADAEHYLHVHPVDEKAKGPDATFMTTFPHSGVHKIWGQFQRGGETFVVPFTVNVPE